MGALRVSQLRSAAAADSFLRSRAAVPSWPTDVDLTSEDEDLVAAFHAIDGSGPIDVALPLAESGVQLELGQYLLATRSPDELTDPEAWTLDLEQNPTYAGPTSPLGLLAGPGETTVVVGRHAHCPSAPMPVHPDLQALRRISLQPSDIESCHQWHAVDLYIDDVGDVAAITLEAYEP